MKLEFLLHEKSHFGIRHHAAKKRTLQKLFIYHCKKLNQFLTVCKGLHDRGNDT
jgi:hypothetical protein